MVSAIAGSYCEGASWLEPCVGKGAFLKALQSHGISRSKIRGLDIEPDSPPSDRLARIFRPRDFFEWAADTQERFDRIIANPPFVRLRMYHSRFQPAIRQLASTLPGVVTLDCNAWLLFLYGSLQLLREGGSCAFVLPAAWDYADYAAVARDELPRRFREFEVHRSLKPLFEEVKEGAVVLVGKGYRKPHRRFIRCEHESEARLCATLSGITKPKSVRQIQRARPDLTTLSSYCTIRIGAVTGDNDYFLLTEVQRQSLGIPEAACLPVLSRARHLGDAYITRKFWSQLKRIGERVWLFRPDEHELSNKYIASYLARSTEEGGCNQKRRKIRGRDPWYITPVPPRVHGFISGMSTLGPWIALNGYRLLNASNTLYVIEFSHGLDLDQRAGVGLSLLSSVCRVNLRPRRYADGLPKWEPNDLASLVLPIPPIKSGALKVYRDAIAVARERGISEASAIADSWLSSTG